MLGVKAKNICLISDQPDSVILNSKKKNLIKNNSSTFASLYISKLITIKNPRWFLNWNTDVGVVDDTVMNS